MNTNDFAALFEGGDEGNDGDSMSSFVEEENNNYVIASWAPVYFYYVPFASNRQAGHMIPLVGYSYLGGSLWGMKDTKFLDLGLGFSLYLLDFRVGWNTFRSESQHAFETIEDDSSVSRNSFYTSISLSTGFWFSLGTE